MSNPLRPKSEPSFYFLADEIREQVEDEHLEPLKDYIKQLVTLCDEADKKIQTLDDEKTDLQAIIAGVRGYCEATLASYPDKTENLIWNPKVFVKEILDILDEPEQKVKETAEQLTEPEGEEAKPVVHPAELVDEAINREMKEGR